MSLVKINPSGWSYYATEIASGREDYYLAAGIESTWAGSGAKALGIHGEVVSEEGLAALFGRGMHPLNGIALGASYKEGEERRVAGFALTFSPPKSVSVLWALAGTSVAEEVEESHRAAAEVALKFLETHAAFTRLGRGGLYQADTEGYLAAAFVHRTSRAADPQLHTHVLIANKVRADDGKWRSLDGRELFVHQKAAGMLYKAALRAELSSRIGVACTEVNRNGIAEIQGVPHELIERWSTRRGQVERLGNELVAEREAELGRSLRPNERAQAFQLAAYRSRAPKVTGEESTETLRANWQSEAAGWGLAFGTWLPDLVVPPEQLRSDEEVVTEAIRQLEQRAATFGRARVLEVVSTLVSAARAGEVSAEVERLSNAVLAHGEVLGLSAPLPGDPPDSLRRRDGMALFERHGASRFTTRNVLRNEAVVLEVAARGQSCGAGFVSGAGAELEVARHDLGEDQRDAVLSLVTRDDRVAALVGPAGAGKSRALGALAAIYGQAGYAVVGVAPSAAAAEVLQQEAGISSDTLAKFLLEQQSGSRAGLGRRTVVVLDEASMARSDDLARLCELVEAADAKLVLVGDRHQLGAVGPGGMFATLVDRHGAAELETTRRFVHAWEGAATLRLRGGDASILSTYLRHGRIEDGLREEMLDAAFASWQEARAGGRSSVLMAGDNATVDELARRARAARVQAGEVERGGLLTAHGTIGVGDEVVSLQNDRRLRTDRGEFVRNGHRWVVTEREGSGTVWLSSVEGRGVIELPAAYAAEHLALSYALTVHKAQGTTSDEAVLLVDAAMTAEQLYVGMTRGRERNRALVVTEQAGDGHRSHWDASALELLGAVLARHGEDRSAHDVLLEELESADSRELLKELLGESTRFIDRSAGPDRRDEFAELAARVDLDGATKRLGAAERAAQDAADRRTEAEAWLQQLREPVRARLPGRLGAAARGERQAAQEVAAAELQRATSSERATWGELAAARHHHFEQRELAGDLARLEELQERRAAWLAAHPDEQHWQRQLEERLAVREHEARAEALQRQREELAGVPDQRLVDQVHDLRRELQRDRSDLQLHDSSLKRRERVVASRPELEGRFAESDARARSEIARLTERLEQLTPRLAGIEEELSRRGIYVATKSQPRQRVELEYPGPDFSPEEKAAALASRMNASGPHLAP